ncbi:MAG: ATP-dependent DNA helicase RecG, ATP-dependent DNA helicase RecG [Candidatus Gottesmanbacteria bacterium GW2011_GWA2_43_14]|uniref:Probable DNA 3'-5' helicase RecG n=1 Tax=Candidatus Gottesmanbacteria bacterium GW2011_GWA2_43_14 TaxID=1618443 RepID=A0A0G1DLC4_9BACT|nr:MAG: ATP-dependent DNA helicase RecG, ATP-dependent DNA helicase RecG [Candidatus Gottesmanbacteria bacterium GW2011_GWA2_43_14]
MFELSSKVDTLAMIGPVYRKLLEKLGINTIGDLLYHVPFRYENYSLVSKINQLQPGETVSVHGRITDFKNIYTRTGKKLQKAKLSDETGEISLIWFNQTFLSSILIPGTELTVAGEVKFYERRLAFIVPQYEIYTNNSLHIHTAGLIPVYPETKGLTSKWLRAKIAVILKRLNPEIREFLPPTLLEAYNLPVLKEALGNIHFPKDYKQAESARRRMAFEELLIIQLAAAFRKKALDRQSNAKMITVDEKSLAAFIKSLPFQLTRAQERALSEILGDIKRDKPMLRLLSGDVGSGKTIVAVLAVFATCLAGYKSILLAPTEILASQHYRTISKLLDPWGIKIAYITSREKTARPEDYPVTVGTHALLYNYSPGNDLGLLIIDEQHRFGVEQRAVLSLKNKQPHVLSMTATPIPRTIGMTLFADLDLSLIDEMPRNRLAVKTYIVKTEKREAAYGWIKEKILKSRHNSPEQVFIICPFIEASETLATVKSANEEYDRLGKDVLPGLNLGLLHGRLKPAEKSAVLAKFQNKEIDILVATPIVEVGIDFPSATVILIEAADRFGLAQLHQLRGRVGRGNLQSYCLLFTESREAKVLDRLNTLTRFRQGHELAEYDLKMRGPGEFFGTRQHGGLGLKFADFSDLSLIKKTRSEAVKLLKQDPELKSSSLLRDKVLAYTIIKDTID